MAPSFGSVLATIDRWGTEHAAAAVVGPAGVVASHGDMERVLRWASVTKLVTALAVLSTVEAGVIYLDEPAGPPGSTVRHLLAHASGLGFEGDAILAAPGTMRIYSNPGFDRLGELVATRLGMSFESVVRARILEPLGMTGISVVGRPSQGLIGPLSAMAGLARELLRPTTISATTLDGATRVVFPGLRGVLPGVGRFDPLDWGLGFELRDRKVPHWTGALNASSTFGHFGGSGSFLWVDPELDHALVCLTDREFGPWALEAWPALSDAVIGAIREGAGGS